MGENERFTKLKHAFGGKTKAPFLINNVMVGDVTIAQTDNNDYSFKVSYNYSKLREVMPDDMAKTILASDSDVYYLSDYC